jgi:tetratricopeptide (TPR) repeat protein
MSLTREWVELGKKFFQQRDYRKAEEYLRRVAQNNQHYADVHNMLGVIYHSESRFSDAIAAFEKALDINPNYTEALMNLAVLNNDLGNYSDARKLYDTLRKRGKAVTPKGKAKKGDEFIEPVVKGKLTNMHADLADIYCGLGLYAQAIDEYERALALNPKYTDIKTKLGIAQREHGKLADSVKTLREACKINGKFLQAKVQLGVTLYAMGKNTEARKTWNDTLKTDPENRIAQMYLSLCEAQ